MNVAVCPTAKELADFLVGDLTGVRAAEVENHIDGCESCQQSVLAHESRPDWLVEALPAATQEVRAATEGTVLTGEVNWRSVLSRVQALRGASAGERAAQHQRGNEPDELRDIRDYRLLSKLGEGGMGTVYLARHEKLGRDVALKLMHSHSTHRPHLVSRFEREMKAVGKLDHPAIVRATDAGVWEGRHYLVMEYISGVALNDLIKTRGPLPIPEACELIRQAAEALHYAHARGLVHRDVKPANLMLTDLGGVKVLDMGLALLQESEGGAPELTSTGQFMGTLDYMAPEQASNSHTVDRRADIYSLGATLYALLAGEAPIDMTQQPSLLGCLMSLTKDEPAPLRQRRAAVPEQLADIVHRMLRKSPDDRFGTLAEVAEALAPFAAGSNLASFANSEQPSAETISSAAQLTTVPSPEHAERKPVRPSQMKPVPNAPPRLWWIAGGLAVAGLAALGIILSLQTSKGTIEVQLAEGVDAQQISIAVKQGGEVVEVVDASKGWKIRLKGGAYEVELKTPGDTFKLEKESVTVERHKKTLVHVLLKEAGLAAKSEPAVTERPSAIAPLLGRWTPGTKPRLLEGLVPEPADLPGISRWQMVCTAPVSGGDHAHSVPNWHPDGQRFVVWHGLSEIRLAQVFEVKGSQLRLQWAFGEGVQGEPSWSPNGRYIATKSGKHLQIWDFEKRKLVRRLPDHRGFVQFAWGASSDQIATVSDQDDVRVWNIANGESIQSLTAVGTTAIAWSLSSPWLVIGTIDKKLRLWNTETGKEGATIDGLAEPVTMLAWNPKDSEFASYSAPSNVVRFWSSEGKSRGQVQATQQQHWPLSWSHDGKQISLTAQHSIQVWSDWQTEKPRMVATAQLGMIPVASFARQDHRLAMSEGHYLAVGEFVDGIWKTAASLGNFGNVAVESAAASDGRTLATLNLYRQLTIWDADGKKARVVSGMEGDSKPCFSPDGGRVLVMNNYNGSTKAVVADVAGGARELLGHTDLVLQAAWSPNGKRIATSSKDTTLRIWNPATGKRELIISEHTGPVTFLAWNTTGDKLVSRSDDGTMCVWNADTGKLIVKLAGDASQVRGLAWHPDGKQLASWGVEPNVRLWDAQTGAALGVLAEFPTPLYDGQWLAGGKRWFANGTRASDGSRPLSVWDVEAKKLAWSANRPAWPGLEFAIVSSDELRIAHTSMNSPASVLDAQKGHVIMDLSPYGGVGAISWGSGGETLLMRKGRDLEVLNVGTEIVQWLGYLLNDKTAVAITPAGEILNPTLEQDSLLAYVVETLEGELQLLSPAEFRKLAAGDLSVLTSANSKPAPSGQP